MTELQAAEPVLLEAGRDDFEAALLAALTGVASNPAFVGKVREALDHAEALARGAVVAMKMHRARLAQEPGAGSFELGGAASPQA